MTDYTEPIIGIDEVGRGAWAGPLLVAAVMLDEIIDGLDDSKKLTKKIRKKLSEEILAKSEFVGFGWVDPGEIDSLGMTKAVELGCKRALEGSDPKIRIILDGNINYLNDRENVTCMIGADSRVFQVSAASIVAKVARDEYMTSLVKEYPDYGFESHVGYGTKLHLEMLNNHGVTRHHRLSFRPMKELYGAT